MFRRSGPLYMRRNAVPAIIFLAFAALPLVVSASAERYLLDLAARMMIFAIAAVALDLLVGYGALVSFGHAAFVGLGAYATGIVCLRTKGVYFIMITLAFGQMLFFTATSLAPYGGDNGLTIASRNL